MISAGVVIMYLTTSSKKDSKKLYLKIDPPVVDLKNQSVEVGVSFVLFALFWHEYKCIRDNAQGV